MACKRGAQLGIIWKYITSYNVDISNAFLIWEMKTWYPGILWGHV